MEDEVFEKYYEMICDIFAKGCTGYVIRREKRRAKLKEILEEIENNAKGKVLHQVFDKEAKP